MSNEVELQRIELDHFIWDCKLKLSEKGLKSGSVGVGLVFVAVLVLIFAAYSTTAADPAPLSGWHIVAIIFILVAGLVAYFGLVFWREVKLASEFSPDGAKVAISMGATTDTRKHSGLTS